MAAARNKGKSKGKTSKGSSAAKPRASDPSAKDSDGTTKQPATSEPDGAGPATPRRDIRPFVYAGFDLAFALLYVVLLIRVFPSNHGSTQLLVYLMVASMVAMAGAMFVRNQWGWRVAVGGCAAMLVIAVVVLILLLVSAAFLAGVYGAFGQAASMVTLVAAALTIELVALVPALQLKFLMTRAGRRHFGREPLWR